MGLGVKEMRRRQSLKNVEVDLQYKDLVNATIIFINTMRLLNKQLIVLVWLLASCAWGQDMSLTSCIEYLGGVCIRCSLQAHLHQGICYHNIIGCISYANGTICTQCDSPSFVLTGSNCSVAPGVTLAADQQLLYRYGDATSSNPGDRYGQANFMPTTLDVVRAWPTFMALNTYILRGQYSHFISRMSNPIFSVHYYTKNSLYSYKILYYGSGGGLFLCIADVSPSMSVTLRSLTPISASDIIDFCADYDTSSKCLRCNSTYHLQNSRCYSNQGGCSKYRENICIECLDYFFLIQNRCVSDCVSLSDARSVLYYGNDRDKSSLQSSFGISIAQFYSFSFTQVVTTVTTTVTRTSGGIIGTSFGNSTNSSTTISSGQNGAIILNDNTILNGVSTSGSQSSPTSQLSSSSFSSFSSTSAVGPVGSNRDPNCASYDSNNKCIKCAYFYFKNVQDICQAVDPQCETYNQANGQCKSCYPSYVIKQGKCLTPN